MTNADSILKSSDITLLTKVHTVKPMVFLVVMNRCESWFIRRLSTKELMFLNGGAAGDFWESLGLQRSNQTILKEVNLEYSLEGLMLKLKLQYFGHLIWRGDSWEKTLMLGKIYRSRRRRQQDEMVRWHQLNGHEFEQIPGDNEGQESLACCSPWGDRELDMS